MTSFGGNTQDMRRPEPWESRYYRDALDKLRERDDRRRVMAESFGVRVESLESFRDLSHLALPDHLADRKSGRKWKREETRKVTSWRWKET